MQLLRRLFSGTSGWIVGLILCLRGISVSGHQADDAQVHLAAARTAAGQEHSALFNFLCNPATTPLPIVESPPARSAWHADPVKVFDNLYFVGQTEYSSWAVTTSDGIILVDALYDYSVEDEIVGGLRTLGFDPARIRYVIISHGHDDHAGGARYLQDHFGVRVIASSEDWGLMERDAGSWPKPKRDMVATDGQKLVLGDTTVTLHLTPGHTRGTISTLIPVTDGGTPHVVAIWGGTGPLWLRKPEWYITAATPNAFWFDLYGRSAERFREVVTKAGADVILSNHTRFDGSQEKLPTLAKRTRGDPNPFVIGKDGVRRYLTVAAECARAGALRFK
jgi:metallo-beta-lactamase class B